jgi:hypothetical protein
MIYGYARVSTDGQSVDAQMRQLMDVGLTATSFEAAIASAARRERIAKLSHGSTTPAARVPFFDWLAGETRGGFCDGTP